jgi:hypothetical protein
VLRFPFLALLNFNSNYFYQSHCSAVAWHPDASAGTFASAGMDGKVLHCMTIFCACTTKLTRCLACAGGAVGRTLLQTPGVEIDSILSLFEFIVHRSGTQ